MTKIGFYSITRKNKEKGGTEYHVRAREKQDIQNLKDGLKLDDELNDWPTSDYQFRIIVNQKTYRRIMFHLTSLVTYDNFKSMIHTRGQQHRKKGLYSRVWGVMRELDDRPHIACGETKLKAPGDYKASLLLDGDVVMYNGEEQLILSITELDDRDVVNNLALEFILKNKDGDETAVQWSATGKITVQKWRID